MSNNERATKSATDYIDQLFENHSKLQVIRLDLYHKKTADGPRELTELKQDVAHLISNSRSNKSLFGDMKGKIIKYENGDDRGPHAHTILFFDGQKLQKDAHRGDEIGKYWSENITNGNGTYHNVNRNKEMFERVGIGMIDQADTEKRQALLDIVLPYVTKTDQSIDKIKSNPKERCFSRGAMPKPKSNAGRPRKTETETTSEVEKAEEDSEDQAASPPMD